jgi:hypothetical protein
MWPWGVGDIPDISLTRLSVVIAPPMENRLRFFCSDTHVLWHRQDWLTFFFGAMILYLWLRLLAVSIGVAKLLIPIFKLPLCPSGRDVVTQGVE